MKYTQIKIISKSLPLIAILFLAAISANAQVFQQNQPQQDCLNAIPICGNHTENTGYLGFGPTQEIQGAGTNISNPNVNPGPPANSGCLLSGELNVVWFEFNFTCDGWFSWWTTITQGTGCFDWTMFDLTGDSCQSIQNGSIAPIRCNWNGNCNGTTGMMWNPLNIPNGNQTNFQYPLWVTGGSKYVLCLSNFSGQASGFTLFMDSTTACLGGEPVFADAQDSLKCGDSIIDVLFKNAFLCNTLSANGSEFRLVDSATLQNVPIKSAVGLNGCTNGFETELRLSLYEPIKCNGTYYLFTKKGTDYNTLESLCNSVMAENDTFTYHVNDCYRYLTPLDLTNVTVIDNDQVRVQWAGPSGAFDSIYFQNYQIVRGGANITSPLDFELAPITSSSLRSFVEVDPEPTQGFYTYAIGLNMISCGDTIPISDSIATIFLSSPTSLSAQTPQIIVNWTPYWGWFNPEYWVVLQDSLGDTTHVSASSLLSDTIDRPLVDGMYKVWVETVNPQDTTLVSQSNYLTFNRITPPPIVILPLFLPNVVTPNGDGVNDALVVRNLEQYPGSKIVITNRWGQEVYSNEDYKNDWVADASPGSYYVFLEVSDGRTFKGLLQIL
jgi:gliding motility-associated-like protein